jgi:putative transcriptional regulator
MTAAAKIVDVGNHPNRGRGRSSTSNPTPAEIRAARERAGLTQTEAAAKIRGNLRSWQNWESDENAVEHRRMHPGLFELFLIKCGQPLLDWMKD